MAKGSSGRRAVLAARARRDIREILRWSEEQFGKAAARRYEALLVQALRDIEVDPQRSGVRQRAGLPADVFLYHLAASRAARSGAKVKTPRHFLAYRLPPGKIEIIRVLHDSRDLARHLAEASSDVTHDVRTTNKGKKKPS